ncbi:hypothetical protein [Vibrio salinus]|uniref:hypothetical protein n=1 Tax=Vibrio salinus TaxID=2899784 RepID=UPI001E31F5A3|nr:hypothetical protein [Vibrio salinus]MCE0495455.1 hypothetical protein [Vibrio salinus]
MVTMLAIRKDYQLNRAEPEEKKRNKLRKAGIANNRNFLCRYEDIRKLLIRADINVFIFWHYDMGICEAIHIDEYQMACKALMY